MSTLAHAWARHEPTARPRDPEGRLVRDVLTWYAATVAAVLAWLIAKVAVALLPDTHGATVLAEGLGWLVLILLAMFVAVSVVRVAQLLAAHRGGAGDAE